jgi:prolipoprotein diacylglyceryltransferase
MLWGLIGLIATIWVIYDVLTAQKKMPDIEKLIWVLVAFFLGIIGAVIYYLIVKKSGKYEETEELSV